MPAALEMDDARGGSRDNPLIVYARLRESILRGDLPSGAPLPQGKLAEEFGVSRGPIREALRMLQQEGLVTAEVNKRARVAELSESALEQLYVQRVLTESFGLSVSVPRFTSADFASMSDLLAEMSHGGEAPVDWEEPHRRFHLLLVSYAGDLLVEMTQQSLDHASRYMRWHHLHEPSAWSTDDTEHRAIVAACEARDELGAARLLGKHLALGALSLLLHVSPAYNPALLRAALRMVMMWDSAGSASDPKRLDQRGLASA